MNDNPTAAAFFKTLSSRNRYSILYRIGAVKKAETRERKIREFVAMLARGHGWMGLHCRTLDQWRSLLDQCGFDTAADRPNAGPALGPGLFALLTELDADLVLGPPEGGD